MGRIRCLVVLISLFVGYATSARAQQSKSPKALSPVVRPTSSPVSIAATVNGQPITENAVQRGLQRVDPDQQAQARPAILDFLIDNVLLDQCLAQRGVTVERTEIDAKIQQVREEIKKNNQSFDQLLHDLMSTEQEFRAHVEAQIRWDKYADQQATDDALLKMFAAEREMFDGTMVRARHILLSPAPDDPAAAEKAKSALLLYRKQIEDGVKQELAKLPSDTAAPTRESARCRLLDEAFAEFARKYSACPTKEQGGDVDWFPRAGCMVEAFSKAAFATKPHAMTDVVKTPFGYHLILVTDRRTGVETKFDEVKAEVKDLYCARLRESMCAEMRPKAKITINPPAKP